jgi:hypothetical protein
MYQLVALDSPPRSARETKRELYSVQQFCDCHFIGYCNGLQ